MPTDVKLVFQVPGRTAKGFPRRMLRATQFKAAFDANQVTPDVIQGLVAFLTDFVEIEGMEKEQVQEVMWDLSQDEFENLLGEITGGKQDAPLAT